MAEVTSGNYVDQYCKVMYDYNMVSEQGITALPDVQLPFGAIITKVFYDVITPLNSVGQIGSMDFLLLTGPPQVLVSDIQGDGNQLQKQFDGNVFYDDAESYYKNLNSPYIQFGVDIKDSDIIEGTIVFFINYKISSF